MTNGMSQTDASRFGSASGGLCLQNQKCRSFKRPKAPLRISKAHPVASVFKKTFPNLLKCPKALRRVLASSLAVFCLQKTNPICLKCPEAIGVPWGPEGTPLDPGAYGQGLSWIPGIINPVNP